MGSRQCRVLENARVCLVVNPAARDSALFYYSLLGVCVIVIVYFSNKNVKCINNNYNSNVDDIL